MDRILLWIVSKLGLAAAEKYITEERGQARRDKFVGRLIRLAGKTKNNAIARCFLLWGAGFLHSERLANAIKEQKIK